MSFRDLIGPGRFIDPAVIQASAARGDDWYPYAARMPLTPEATSQPKRQVTHTSILHTESGPRLTTLENIYEFISRVDITGEPTAALDMDGRMGQFLPIETRADNNYRANAYATSIETQDEGTIADPGIANTPWTDMQLAQLAGWCAWQVLHPRLDIPLRRADQGPTGGGIDGHYRYEDWSIYTGKTCPGLTRRGQIDDVLAAARSIIEWTPDPMPPASPNEEDLMLFIARDDGKPTDPDGYHGYLILIGDGKSSQRVRQAQLGSTQELEQKFARRLGAKLYDPTAPYDAPKLVTSVAAIPKLPLEMLYLLVGNEQAESVPDGATQARL